MFFVTLFTDQLQSIFVFPIFLIFIHLFSGVNFLLFIFICSFNHLFIHLLSVPLLKLRNVFKLCSANQRLNILSALEILLVESSLFFQLESFTTFVFLLLLSLDDEYSFIRGKSVQIWNRIKSISIETGQYAAFRSSLMSSFISILGQKDTENNHNPNLKLRTNVDDLTKLKADVFQNDNRSNFSYDSNNKNIMYVKNFRDFYNGNDENGLQDLLKLFQGLGAALGEAIKFIKFD